MPSLYRYKLFISHAWKYSESYNRIISFLDDANNFSYSNYSVPVSDGFEKMTGSQLGIQIQEQIRPVGVVIILGGMYVTYSEWIQYEISYAKLIDKPILGITPFGGERMPSAVTIAADEIVKWNTASIVDAIRRLSA